MGRTNHEEGPQSIRLTDGGGETSAKEKSAEQTPQECGKERSRLGATAEDKGNQADQGRAIVCEVKNDSTRHEMVGVTTSRIIAFPERSRRK